MGPARRRSRSAPRKKTRSAKKNGRCTLTPNSSLPMLSPLQRAELALDSPKQTMMRAFAENNSEPTIMGLVLHSAVSRASRLSLPDYNS